MMSTPSSCAAFSAPAWMLCQNTCDVPFGITAMVSLPRRRRRRAARREQRRRDQRARTSSPFSHTSSHSVLHRSLPAKTPETRCALPPSTASRSAERALSQVVVDDAPSCARSRRPRCTPASPIRPSAARRRSSRTRRRGTAEIWSGVQRCPVRLGHQPRQLAAHVAEARPAAADRVAHSSIAAALDVRLAEMVEHEALAREPRARARPPPADAADRSGCRRRGRARRAATMPRQNAGRSRNRSSGSPWTMWRTPDELRVRRDSLELRARRRRPADRPSRPRRR